MKIIIPVSPGELIDKITILEIKSRRIKDKAKLKSVKAELKLLRGALPSHTSRLKVLKAKLSKANTALWNIEDEIRKLEAKKDFGKKFVQLARSVYINNDKRFEIKNQINKLLGSKVKEVKQYVNYKK